MIPPQTTAQNNSSSIGSLNQQVPRQAPNPFVTLNGIVSAQYQQIGLVLSGPGRLEDRRETFQTQYPDLNSRFQQVADKVGDDISHAQHVIRGAYAVFLEKNQKIKAEEERLKSKLEQEVQEKKAKSEADEKKKEQHDDVKTDQSHDQDVIMIDSPSHPPPAATAPSTLAHSQIASEAPIQSTTPIVLQTSDAPPNPPFQAPSFDIEDTGTNEAANETNFDFEAMFGNIGETAPDETTKNIDPSADDLASLIPGIDTYASMDPSTTNVTTSTTTATVSAPPMAAALDFMDFNTPDAQTGQNTDQTIADNAGFGAGGNDDYLDFLNGGDAGEEDGQPVTNDNDLDDWLNAMHD